MANSSDLLVAALILAFAYHLMNQSKREPTQQVTQPFAGTDHYAQGLVDNTPWAASKFARR